MRRGLFTVIEGITSEQEDALAALAQELQACLASPGLVESNHSRVATPELWAAVGVAAALVGHPSPWLRKRAEILIEVAALIGQL